jgi:hypothetical protein
MAIYNKYCLGNGVKYCVNITGQYHKTDGPAIIYDDGYKIWAINGDHYYTNSSFQRAAGISDEDMAVIILKYGNIT